MLHRLLMFFAAVGVLPFLLACAGEEAGNDSTIDVAAKDARFTPDLIEVPSGQVVRLRLKNHDTTEHDLEVRGLTPTMVSGGGHEGHGEAIRLRKVVAVHTEAKGTAVIEFIAGEKGTYEVICTIPGHAQAGMVATLIVT